MADSVVRLTVNSSEYDQKLKRAAEGLTRYADECRKVGGTMEVVEKDTLDYVRALGQMDTVSRTATGKLAEMKKTFTELSVVYNKMTAEEKQSPFGQALSQSLDQLKVRINDSKTELNEVNQSLVGSGGLKDALNGVASQFGMNIEQLTKFGGLMGATTAAVKVAKDAFFQSESNIDEWGRTVEGAKGAYNVFLDTLNNGNWSNFFQNLQTAIQGGRDLYDVFDRLGSIKSNNAAAIAITQKEIAELRLAKQQGENVDAKLKAATERLAALQKQSVSAGMTAGSQSAFQTIRNGVNSIGGAGVNDATIQYAVDRIMKGGQAEFDKYKRNYEVLQKRGIGMTTSYQTTAYGGTMAVQSREFNLANLTQEEQKQYAIAKAITEGETQIQKGIAAYAQAVSEGTASAREEFKGNRYALQGAGGSGGGGKGGSGDVVGSAKANFWENIAFNPKEFDDSLKFDPSQYAQASGLRPEDILGPSDAWEEYKNTITGTVGSVKESFDNLTEWTTDFDPFKEKMDDLTKTAKQNQMVMSLAGQAVNSFSAALAGMEDPGAKAAGIVIQSLASIALGFAQAAASPLVTGTGWGWLAFVAAGLGAMATAISTVHSLTGYAQGGIVEGNSYSGDNMMFGGDGLYGLNAGELVLTKSQQNSLAQQLSGNGMGNINVTGRISGTDILLSADRAAQASGRGQLVTWK